jgi:hypothetical protein
VKCQGWGNSRETEWNWGRRGSQLLAQSDCPLGHSDLNFVSSQPPGKPRLEAAGGEPSGVGAQKAILPEGSYLAINSSVHSSEELFLILLSLWLWKTCSLHLSYIPGVLPKSMCFFRAVCGPSEWGVCCYYGHPRPHPHVSYVLYVR